MITKRERKRLKKIIGKEYSYKVLKELNAKGLRNRLGNPYSLSHIRNVFAGKRSHEIIENAIYTAAETAIEKNRNETERRERILQSA